MTTTRPSADAAAMHVDGDWSTVIPTWEVRAVSWAREPGDPGMRVRTLWSSDQSRAELLLLDVGAGLPLHTHRDEEQHAFVVEGTCQLDGRLLAAGSYAHIPAGAPHEIRGERPFGAQVLYVFERGA